MPSRRIKLRKIDGWRRIAASLQRVHDDGGMMFQRALIAASLALGLLAMPPAAAGQAQKIFRVGHLDGSPPATGNPRGAELRRGLREHGYVEGQNLVIEYRWTGGRNEGFPALAAELVRLKVDIIVAHASPAVRAAKEATTTIPIVLLNVADPVGEGLVTSLRHPSGNITGVSNQSADFMGKLLELSKETLPRLVRVAVIAPAAESGSGVPGPGTRARIKELEASASALGVTIHPVVVHDAADFPRAFAKITEQRDQAVVILPDHVTWFHRTQILDLAARSRLPTICVFEVWGQAGCVLAFGPNLSELWYRAGVLAGKLMKGAKPADLPVEQPTVFELVINLKTAKALDLRIPPSVLARTDKVIE